MATATIAVVFGRRTTLERRAEVSDAFGGQLGSSREIVRGTVAFAVAAQIIGTVAFAIVLALSGRELRAPGGIVWASLFQSISAFNNAGFDLVGGGLGYMTFADRPAVLLVTAVLIVLGGLGFAIMFDVSRKRRWARLALESKLVLVATAALIVAGAVGILAAEWTNQATFGALTPIDRVWNGLFMSVSPRSAGFSSVDMSALRAETDIVLMLLMFVGGASGSTAGGIKVGTLAILILVAVSVAARRDDPEAFGRRVATETVYRAIAVFFIFSIMNFAGLLLVASLSSVAPGATLFEVVSAVGTVGLSVGVTAEYGDAARVALALCMFVGRLGPLAVIILLFGRSRDSAVVRRPEEPIRVG
jgi:trk system potassium uptake protein TrkH